MASEYIEVVLDERQEEHFYVDWADRSYEAYRDLLLDAHQYIEQLERLENLFTQYRRDSAWKTNTEEIPQAGTQLATLLYEETRADIEETVADLADGAAGDGVINAISVVQGVLTKTIPANPLHEDRFHEADEHLDEFKHICRYYPAPELYHPHPENEFEARFLYTPLHGYHQSVFDLAHAVAREDVSILDDKLQHETLEERANAQVLREAGHPVGPEQVDSRVVHMEEYEEPGEPDDVNRTFQ